MKAALLLIYVTIIFIVVLFVSCSMRVQVDDAETEEKPQKRIITIENGWNYTVIRDTVTGREYYVPDRGGVIFLGTTNTETEIKGNKEEYSSSTEEY